MLADREMAEDCVAEIFCRFLVAAQAGTPFENPRAYLYRVAHNWILDHRRLPAQVSLEDNMQLDQAGNPSQVLMQNLDRQRVHSAIVHLSPEQRQVIELRYLEDRPHIEVAEALGKTVEATRALQHRAIKSLRQTLVELHP
jgi:RNA polymerase sigma-70 factor (ECF subfamily)